MRWGTKDVAELRVRLTSNTVLLTAWIKGVHPKIPSGSHADGKSHDASQANVEKKKFCKRLGKDNKKPPLKQQTSSA
jgi:hypothetical protein